MNRNENTVCQNVWDVAKAGLRGKFIAVNAQIKKEERSQIGILTAHLNELEKKRRPNKTQSQQKLGNSKDYSRDKIDNQKIGEIVQPIVNFFKSAKLTNFSQNENEKERTLNY